MDEKGILSVKTLFIVFRNFKSKFKVVIKDVSRLCRPTEKLLKFSKRYAHICVIFMFTDLKAAAAIP